MYYILRSTHYSIHWGMLWVMKIHWYFEVLIGKVKNAMKVVRLELSTRCVSCVTLSEPVEQEMNETAANWKLVAIYMHHICW